MTKDQLASLKKASQEMSQIAMLINEMDDEDDTPQAAKALLTAQAGCFTTLVHVAEMLSELVAQTKMKAKEEVRWVQ